MRVERDFLVGISDVDFDNKLTNKALIEAFSNMANVHGYILGHGSGRLQEVHFGWVVLNWKLEVYDRPEVCENYKVVTWSQSANRLKAFRDFEVFDKDQKLIAKATSMWVAIDIETGMPIRITEEIMAPYESEPDRVNFPDYVPSKGKAPEEYDFMGTVKTMKSMIDCNHHVHNSCYFDLLNEILPETISQNDFNDIEIVYKKEVKPESEVCVTFKDGEEVSYGVVKSIDGETIHSVFILKK